MNSFDFFEKFKNLFVEPESLSVLRKDWNSREKFTKTIISFIENILPNNKEYYRQREYYRIDLVGWKNQKNELEKSNIKPNTTYTLNEHFWSLDIAIEHENDQFDWTDELIKLLYVNCPLRIVIGYYPENLSEESKKETLDYASKIVTLANKDQTLIRSNQEYMLILGKNHTDSKQLGKNTYSAYIYDNALKKFIVIE